MQLLSVSKHKEKESGGNKSLGLTTISMHPAGKFGQFLVKRMRYGLGK
jgi:hypothetical protein